MSTPYLFDEFFSSGMEDSISPFLKPSSRKWASNLHIKTAILSAIFLTLSFGLSFIHSGFSTFFLIFVYFLSGTPALYHTIEDLKGFEINIDVLMTLAAFLSVIIGSQIEGALLLVLFDLSHGMESLVTKKAKGALHQLTQLSPATAHIVQKDGSTLEKSVKEIELREKILVKAGEVVPLDGIVRSGASDVNLVHLTGESAPIPKHPDDEVQAGSLNLDGSLTIEVSKVSADSTLAKITKLITQAQEMKPKFQRFLDRFSKIYATSIIGLSAFFALVLPLFFSVPFLGLEGSIYRALAFLIAASPCALIIATPTAYLSAVSACAKKGILMKGGVTLDALAQCQVMAFDKTGTLTTGLLTCESITALSETSISTDEALKIAASLEVSAKHPVAKAILDAAKDKGFSLSPVDAFKSVAGFGVQGQIDGEMAYIGHAGFMKTLDKTLPEDISVNKEGNTVTYLYYKGAFFVFYFKDTIREGMKEVIESLQNTYKVSAKMLTGDHHHNAQKTAETLALDSYEADLRPEDKLERISKLTDEKNLAMVGDGIDDAPSLARATVGISMGQIGSATAVDASDIVLLRDQISLLPWLVNKARATGMIVKQNITLAMAVIVLTTTPALLGFVPLWLAVVLHEGGTVIVGLNSLRLLKK